MLAASLLLHAAILTALAWPNAARFVDRSNDEDAIEVLLDRSRRAARPTRAEARAAARPEAASLVPLRPTRAAPSTVEPLPLAPAPVGPGAPAAGAASGPRGDLGAVLRSAGHGCGGEREARLSPEERARCQERLGALALKAPPLSAPIDPAKRAYYDAVAEAYRNRGQMVPLNARGGNGMFAVDDSVHQGHGPRVGCSVKFGPNARKAPRGPANALRAGPCFIQPPVGSLTPEADIRKPY